MLIFIRYLSFVVLSTVSASLYAQHPFIDVYGTDTKTAEKIIAKVGSDLDRLGQCIQPKEGQAPCPDEQRAVLKKKVLEAIHQMGDFSFLHLSPIIYQDLTLFTTIDLIEKKDQKRRSYLANFQLTPIKNISNLRKDKKINLLLQKWIEYEKKGFSLFFQGKSVVVNNCPAYHCSFGFEHPDFKGYLEFFEKEVPKHKKKLIMILKHDTDEERRKTAALLLAHTKNGHELINILTPSISDPNGDVRNNVMRVLGETLNIVRPTDFDIAPIIRALDFPLETDRNKALYMISSLVKQPKYAHYVAQHGSIPLMRLLKMTQPNLHDFTYLILHQISGHSYGDRNYDAWENWFAEQKNLARG